MNSCFIFIENGRLHEAIFGGKISEFDPGKGKSVATSIYPRVNDELTTKKNNTDSTDIEQIKWSLYRRYVFFCNELNPYARSY